MKSRLRQSENDEQQSASPHAVLPAESPKRAETGIRDGSSHAEKSAGARLPPRHGPPLPHRSKGRGIFSLILLSLLVLGGYLVWNALFRFKAYGVVTGQIIDISTPWPGTVSTIYVREGDQVRQDEVLLVITNPEIAAAIQRLNDEVLVTNAELDAQVALLALTAYQQQDAAQKLLADHYELQGEYLAQESDLQAIEGQLQRYERLTVSRAVPEQEIDSLRFKRAGLQARNEKLGQAIETQANRIGTAEEIQKIDKQLQPWVAKIKQLQGEIALLREKEMSGTVRAPAGGRVMKVRLLVGEFVEPEKPIVELLQESSMELVVFVSQQDSGNFRVGQEIDVLVEPNRAVIRCQVMRVGNRYEAPPQDVKVHYRNNSTTLPVYLAPPDELPVGFVLRLGAEVRVPVF